MLNGKFIDKGGYAGALLTDLSWIIGCQTTCLRFDTDPLKFIYSNLKRRKQRTKINSPYSSFAEILFGIPQGSILGPLLFNTYICDLFYDIDDLDFVSFADDMLIRHGVCSWTA